VLNISNETFFDTMLDFPEVAVAMVRGLSERLTELAQRVHELEGQMAHLNRTLQNAGVETPTYSSGAIHARPSGRSEDDMRYPYVIVGGGLAGASAIEGIRANDSKGAILLVSRENHPPYHRPPLSKDLCVGKSTLDKLPAYDEAFYRDKASSCHLRREIVEVDAEGRQLWDDKGVVVEYEKLLLATGGWPRRLGVEGASSKACTTTVISRTTSAAPPDGARATCARGGQRIHRHGWPRRSGRTARK
jgi:hypothetical protein